MNEFGTIADDLTFMQERLESDDLFKYAAGLQRALRRAFIEACLASRAMRHAEEAQAAPRPRGERKRKARQAEANAPRGARSQRGRRRGGARAAR